MKKVSKVLFAFTLILAVSLSLYAKEPKPKGYHLVWSDEFKARKIDTKKWDFQIGTGDQYGLTDWGNNEQQYYKKENAFIEKGNLVIEAKKEAFNGKQYTSARLRTMKDDNTVLFSKTYGRIEAKIKLPKGKGIWPAFWLLPATTDYGQWASSGEIDIMEAKGRLPNRVYAAVHYGQEWPGNKYSSGMYKFPDNSDISEYHVYALEWEPGLLRWLVDDEVYYETQQWYSLGNNQSEPYKYPAPFDKPFYILLNLAIGGNYDDGMMPKDNDLPVRMYVDYVRVYEKDEPYNENVKKPEPKRDSAKFNTFKTNGTNGFIFDKNLTQANEIAMTQNEMDVNSNQWYFLALSEYLAKAESSNDTIDGKAFKHIKINEVGNQNYSVQLIQHLPIAEGYTYKIEFDAKASENRTIALKVGGDGDNGWAVYSPQYYPELTNEVKHYSYIFTMENATDITARLEFNLGLFSQDIWIGNVTLTQTDL